LVETLAPRADRGALYSGRRDRDRIWQRKLVMSIYALQKLIRDVNRRPASREAFFQSPEQFAQGYGLTDRERSALVGRDIGALYQMGVHGLLLRPFTLLHKMPEPDYLKAIRGE
jgi:hypothetical protein